jgi:(2Fe-2S) ferredoxin
VKVLVCNNEHCKSDGSEEILKELENLRREIDFEFLTSSCMGLCSYGPNVMTFPDLRIYGNVSASRIKDIISSQGSDLLHPNDRIYSKELCSEVSLDPMHRRSVKLFRYHLEKFDDFSVANLRVIISSFENKYEITGNKFLYPIKLALLGTIKGPDLPKIIYFLGKEDTIKSLDKFLKKA